MSDVNHGEAKRCLDIADFLAHAAAQLGIKVGEWLIKQQHLWLEHQCTRDSDALFVCCRGDAVNHHLISQPVIEALGARGCLVNVARGSVVDEDALIAALKDGRLGMAALDVFETEPTPADRWADVPNTVLTPHTAGGTLESIPKMVGQTLENLRRFFHEEPLLSPVQA